MIFEQRPEKRERAMEISGGRILKAEETASAEALRWKCVSCIGKAASIKEAMWLKSREKRREK